MVEVSNLDSSSFIFLWTQTLYLFIGHWALIDSLLVYLNNLPVMVKLGYIVHALPELTPFI